MANPQDGASYIFQLLSQLFLEQRTAKFQEAFHRFGGKTNKWLNPNKKRMGGKKLTVDVETQLLANARVNNDFLADIVGSGTYGTAQYFPTIDKTAASNDLHRISTSLIISQIDLDRAKGNPQERVNLVMKLRRDSRKDIQERLAFERWADSNSTMGVISGVSKDTTGYFDSSLAVTNDSVIRAQLSTPIAYFHDGQVIEAFTAGGTQHASALTLTVKDVNASDNSIAISSSADISAIVAGDELFLSGERGHSYISMGDWFDNSGTTLYGVDRSASGNRWMNTTHTRNGKSNQPMQLSFFDDAAVTLGNISDDDSRGYVMMTSPEILKDFVELVDQAAIIELPAGRDNNFFAKYGYRGAFYRHPTFGEVALQSDQFSTRNIIRLIRPSDWEAYYGTQAGFEWLPGTISDIWSRIPATTNDGTTMFYSAAGYLAGFDICTAPRKQLQINGIAQD